MDSVPAAHTWAPQPRLDSRHGVSEYGAFDAPKPGCGSTELNLVNLGKLSRAQGCNQVYGLSFSGKTYAGMNRLFAQYDSAHRRNRHLSERRDSVLQWRVRAEQ